MLEHGLVYKETFRHKLWKESERSQDTLLILSLTHILLAAVVFPQRAVLSRLLHPLQCTWPLEAEKAVGVLQSEEWSFAGLVEKTKPKHFAFKKIDGGYPLERWKPGNQLSSTFKKSGTVVRVSCVRMIGYWFPKATTDQSQLTSWPQLFKGWLTLSTG